MIKVGLELSYKTDRADDEQRLIAEIDVNGNGSFIGGGYYPNLGTKHLLRGYVRKDDNLERLLFLLFPESTNLADTLFSFEREGKDSIEGEYSGRWNIIPFKVRFDNANGLFLASKNFYSGLGDAAKVRVYRQ